jgi:O-acetyl-ADP-ribose deacetylase (regulator of RNase III)
MKKGTLKHVRGDVTQPQRSTKDDVVIIPHCCNDKGVMGAGVALGLKKKWPQVYNNYVADLNVLRGQGRTLLGTVSCHMISDNMPGLKGENPRVDTIIYNMIGQHGTGIIDGVIPVKYWALAKAMLAIKNRCANIRETWDWYPDWNPTPVIHTPKFGSDLAGGNWDFILELIREIWLENGIDVVVYEWESDKEKWGEISD